MSEGLFIYIRRECHYRIDDIACLGDFLIVFFFDYSFGKRSGVSIRRPNECLILEPSEMLVVSPRNWITILYPPTEAWWMKDWESIDKSQNWTMDLFISFRACAFYKNNFLTKNLYKQVDYSDVPGSQHPSVPQRTQRSSSTSSAIPYPPSRLDDQVIIHSKLLFMCGSRRRHSWVDQYWHENCWERGSERQYWIIQHIIWYIVLNPYRELYIFRNCERKSDWRRFLRKGIACFRHS